MENALSFDLAASNQACLGWYKLWSVSQVNYLYFVCGIFLLEYV
jgi:hypothetical protein